MEMPDKWDTVDCYTAWLQDTIAFAHRLLRFLQVFQDCCADRAVKRAVFTGR